MTARAITLLVCLVPIANTVLAAQSSTFSRFPSLVDTLIGGHFEAADSICGIIAYENPVGPEYPYARALVVYSRMIDREDTTGRRRFNELIDSCVVRCTDRLKSDRQAEDAWECHYLRGAAYSAKGIIMGRLGQTLTGLRSLMKSRDDFARCIKLKPDFYDAYLGRGAYRYGVAVHAGFLSGLPLIPSRQSGLDDMWLAVHKSSFSSFQALTAMVWFVLDDGDFQLADSICQAGLSRFPDSRCFLWPLLSLRMKQERWADAEIVAKNLLAQYLALPDNNGYDAIGLYSQLCEIAQQLNRPEEAMNFARQGLLTYRTVETYEKRKEKLRELEVRVAQLAR